MLLMAITVMVIARSRNLFGVVVLGGVGGVDGVGYGTVGN